MRESKDPASHAPSARPPMNAASTVLAAATELDALFDSEVHDVDTLGAIGAEGLHQDGFGAGSWQGDAGVPCPVVAALKLVGAARADVVREYVAADHLVVPVGRLLAS